MQTVSLHRVYVYYNGSALEVDRPDMNSRNRGDTMLLKIEEQLVIRKKCNK